MRGPEEVGALPAAEWVSVSVRCPVTAREVPVMLDGLALETGPRSMNWLTYHCSACGQEHRAGGPLLNVGH